jgi:hypothetical protein
MTQSCYHDQKLTINHPQQIFTNGSNFIHAVHFQTLDVQGLFKYTLASKCPHRKESKDLPGQEMSPKLEMCP